MSHRFKCTVTFDDSINKFLESLKDGYAINSKAAIIRKSLMTHLAATKIADEDGFVYMSKSNNCPTHFMAYNVGVLS